MHDTRQKMGTQTDQQVGVMKETLDRQKNDFWRDLPVSIGKRTDRLRRLEDLLTQNVDSLCQAMSDDFGWRSRHASQLTDIVYTLRATRHAKKNLRNWMRSDRRSIEPLLWLLGGRASVHYQPKGVVGVIFAMELPRISCSYTHRRRTGSGQSSNAETQRTDTPLFRVNGRACLPVF